LDQAFARCGLVPCVPPQQSCRIVSVGIFLPPSRLLMSFYKGSFFCPCFSAHDCPPSIFFSEPHSAPVFFGFITPVFMNIPRPFFLLPSLLRDYFAGSPPTFLLSFHSSILFVCCVSIMIAPFAPTPPLAVVQGFFCRRFFFFFFLTVKSLPTLVGFDKRSPWFVCSFAGTLGSLRPFSILRGFHPPPPLVDRTPLFPPPAFLFGFCH